MEIPTANAPWPSAAFFENQRKFPREELLRYAGQHIAWSWDGDRIVAAAANPETLDRELQAAGFDPGTVVYDYVDDPNTSLLP